MGIIKHNKASRDKIPEIIKESGNICNSVTLSDEQFLIELEKKLVEELTEYQESKNVEELADVLEIIYRISNLKGFDLDKVRLEKIEKRGKFEKNLFLVDTSD